MNGNEKRRLTRKDALRALARVLTAVLLAWGALILLRSLGNGVALINYDSGNYSAFPEALLLPLRLGDNYVVPYNLGNLAYQREEYDRAAEYYARALRSNPPAEEKECAVRVNLALALLQGYDFDALDEKDEAQVQQALEVLYRARGVLTEHGCAHPEAERSDGHSMEAESLKRDIDEMIARLTAQPEPDEGDGDDGDPPPEGGGDSDDRNDDGEGDQDSQEDDGEGGGDQDPRDGESDSPQDAEGEAEDQEQKQTALQSQLTEQKQDLEEGTYGTAGARDFTYIDAGETVGFGEGAPW